MEERFLVKSFQFFDFHRTGLIDFTQFYKTLERVGVIITKANAKKIFDDVIVRANAQTGAAGNPDLLDYRTFARQVYNPETFDFIDNQVHKPLATPVYETGYNIYTPDQSETHSVQAQEEVEQPPARIVRSGYKEPVVDTLDSILKELRTRAKVRGSFAFSDLH